MHAIWGCGVSDSLRQRPSSPDIDMARGSGADYSDQILQPFLTSMSLHIIAHLFRKVLVPLTAKVGGIKLCIYSSGHLPKVGYTWVYTIELGRNTQSSMMILNNKSIDPEILHFTDYYPDERII